MTPAEQELWDEVDRVMIAALVSVWRDLVDIMRDTCTAVGLEFPEALQ